MPNEDFDILIYIPFEEKDLNEKEINWINTFEKILNVGLKQITKQKISLSKSFINKGKISGNYYKTHSFYSLVQLRRE